MFIYHTYCRQIFNKHISGMSQALFRYILPISYQASGISWEYFGPLRTHRYFYSFEMTSVINQISLDISILLIHTEIFAADAGSCLFFFKDWVISKTVLGVFRKNLTSEFLWKHPKLFCLYLSNQILLRGRFVFKTNGRISSMTLYKDKTWSLESNSSLSKTFALASF